MQRWCCCSYGGSGWEESIVSNFKEAICQGDEKEDAEGISHFDNSVDNDVGKSIEVSEKDKFFEMHMLLKEPILKAFKLMDKESKLHSTIDSFCVVQQLLL